MLCLHRPFSSVSNTQFGRIESGSAPVKHSPESHHVGKEDTGGIRAKVSAICKKLRAFATAKEDSGQTARVEVMHWTDY